MSDPRIPNAVAIVVGNAIGNHYFSHNRLNALFMGNGVPGDPPLGNCRDKWLLFRLQLFPIQAKATLTFKKALPKPLLHISSP